MTVSAGTKKYIRIADALRQQLAISGAALGLIRGRRDALPLTNEDHDRLYDALSAMDELATELIESGDGLYSRERMDELGASEGCDECGAEPDQHCTLGCAKRYERRVL